MTTTTRIRQLPTANLQSHTPWKTFKRTIRPLRWYRAMKFGR